MAASPPSPLLPPKLNRRPPPRTVPTIPTVRTRLEPTRLAPETWDAKAELVATTMTGEFGLRYSGSAA